MTYISCSYKKIQKTSYHCDLSDNLQSSNWTLELESDVIYYDKYFPDCDS
jgi:hypothetical protein